MRMEGKDYHLKQRQLIEEQLLDDIPKNLLELLDAEQKHMLLQVYKDYDREVLRRSKNSRYPYEWETLQEKSRRLFPRRNQ